MDEQRLIQTITSEILKRLQGEAIGQNTGGPLLGSGYRVPMDTKELAQYIDHTMLKPDAVTATFDQLCSEAVQYRFKSVCVNSSWVPYVAKKLQGTSVRVCSVVGFPLGTMTSRSKAFETREAIEHGASEIDMVMAIGKL
ncbi:MAG: deoxyribose-phosphate aldolase, partial [Dysgonamonadaceae bacterium]